MYDSSHCCNQWKTSTDSLTSYYSVTTPRFHLQSKDRHCGEAKHKLCLQHMASLSLKHQPVDLPLHTSPKPGLQSTSSPTGGPGGQSPFFSIYISLLFDLIWPTEYRTQCVGNSETQRTTGIFSCSSLEHISPGIRTCPDQHAGDKALAINVDSSP